MPPAGILADGLTCFPCLVVFFGLLLFVCGHSTIYPFPPVPLPFIFFSGNPFSISRLFGRCLFRLCQNPPEDGREQYVDTPRYIHSPLCLFHFFFGGNPLSLSRLFRRFLCVCVCVCVFCQNPPEDGLKQNLTLLKLNFAHVFGDTVQ